MNLTYSCPKCEEATRLDVEAADQPLQCRSCGHEVPLPADFARDQVSACVVCGGQELFIRKDFNQRLGLLVIFGGIAASTVTYFYHMTYATYGILGLTAIADFCLYYCVGNLLECYRCHAEYRGLLGLEGHHHFDLEVYEKYRQLAERNRQLGEQQAMADVEATPTGES